MPHLDFFHYFELDSVGVHLAVGDNAGEKLGEDFEGLYVVAVGPPVSKGNEATVVLAAEHRRDRTQALKGLFSK